jgi:hypothetical protein
MTFLIILIIVIVVILGVLVYLKFFKKKPKSIMERLEELEYYKQNKEFYDLQKKYMGEKGTDLDIMPEGIGEFGLDVTNPIPTSTLYGSNAYLGLLRTLDGVKIGYDRIGSTRAENIPYIIDAYNITKNGETIATLYICPYNKKTSEKAPKGFDLLKLF